MNLESNIMISIFLSLYSYREKGSVSVFYKSDTLEPNKAHQIGAHRGMEINWI